MANLNRQHSFYKDAFEGQTRWIIWALGLLAVLFLYSNAEIPGGGLAWGGLKALLTPSPAVPFLEWLEDISNNRVLGLYVFPILTGFVTLLIAQKLLRRRPLRKLINGLGFIRWRRLFFALFVYLALAIVLWTLAVLIKKLTARPDMFGEFSGMRDALLAEQFKTYNSPMIAIIATLTLPCLILIEEMTFRGFVDQSARRFMSNRWAALLLGASLYAVFCMAGSLFLPALFYQTEAQWFLPLMFVTFLVTGLLYSILCDHDQGIEAAVGLGIAMALFQDFIYPKFMPYVMPHNMSDDFEPPWIVLVDSYLFIPVILILLLWNYGGARDKLS